MPGQFVVALSHYKQSDVLRQRAKVEKKGRLPGALLMLLRKYPVNPEFLLVTFTLERVTHTDTYTLLVDA
jgi:hypothetical protein